MGAALAMSKPDPTSKIGVYHETPPDAYGQSLEAIGEKIATALGEPFVTVENTAPEPVATLPKSSAPSIATRFVIAGAAAFAVIKVAKLLMFGHEAYAFGKAYLGKRV